MRCLAALPGSMSSQRRFCLSCTMVDLRRFELHLDRLSAVGVGRSRPKRFSIGCAPRLSPRARVQLDNSRVPRRFVAIQ